MAFTTAQRVDIRRYCGYAMYGNSPTPMNGYRFFVHYGTLEYRCSNMLPEEETVVTTYLTNLNTLEAAVPGSGTNLDTDQAAVWTHNKNEVRDRMDLFNRWRRELCAFLGVPPGPGLSASSGSIRMVV